MILTHTKEDHVYRVPGYFVVGTSDVISLCGFANYGQVPEANLKHASWRGEQLHRAVHFFEIDGEVPEMADEVFPYFRAYMNWRTDFDFEPIGELEKEIVYTFGGEDTAIGATIDARGMVKGKPYIVDFKTSAKQSGKAKAQKLSGWRLQLQSYTEATSFDESWWASLEAKDSAGRAIVHLHKEGDYTFHDFSAIDDSENWAAAVHVAKMKLANGFALEKR